METENHFSNESMAYDAMFENMQQDLYFNAPEPDDEEEGEEKDDDNDEKPANDEDPPLDEKVVHSPVTTQPGGRPKRS